MNNCPNVHNVFPSLPSTGGGVVMILSVTPKLLDVPAQTGEAEQRKKMQRLHDHLVRFEFTVCLV